MKVGIVGYGKMGRNIFGLFSETPMEVTVLGRDPAEMTRQGRRIEKRLSRAVSGGPTVEDELPRRLTALRFTTSWDALRDCDLVIEAVREDFDTKVEVLRRAEEAISPRAVLTSNTSSLSLTCLAERLRDPTRFCGFHFFHPVQLTSILEIITTHRTSPHIVAFLRQLSRDIGRTPLVMKDRSGSSVNIPLILHCCEAVYILEQGLASPSGIDEVVGQFARVGPCETIDAVGIPLVTVLLRRACLAFAFEQVIPELCHRLIRDGRVGKHAARGLYVYRDGRPTDDVPEYYLNPEQTHTSSGARSDEIALRERLLFPIYFGLLKVAQEELGDLGDLTLGIVDILGLTLDPLQEMRKLGSTGLREVFDRLRRELGPRFDCRSLEAVMATLDDR